LTRSLVRASKEHRSGRDRSQVCLLRRGSGGRRARIGDVRSSAVNIFFKVEPRQDQDCSAGISQCNDSFTGNHSPSCHPAALGSKGGGEALMLRFFCPTAREEFDSGIILDEQTYQRNRLSIVSMICVHCQRSHRFLLADARFTAEEVAA
jgi:hypothetical protein